MAHGIQGPTIHCPAPSGEKLYEEVPSKVLNTIVLSKHKHPLSLGGCVTNPQGNTCDNPTYDPSVGVMQAFRPNTTSVTPPKALAWCCKTRIMSHLMVRL